MCLIYYVAAVVATKIFGAAFPEWFGTIPHSLFTLFQIMTLESWAMGIVRPVSQQFPYAYMFFVPFVLVSSFVILNIFIAVIINAMTEAREQIVKQMNPDGQNASLLEQTIPSVSQKQRRALQRRRPILAGTRHAKARRIRAGA